MTFYILKLDEQLFPLTFDCFANAYTSFAVRGCLARDRGVAGSSPKGGIVLFSRAKQLVLVQPKKQPNMTVKMLTDISRLRQF